MLATFLAAALCIRSASHSSPASTTSSMSKPDTIALAPFGDAPDDAVLALVPVLRETFEREVVITARLAIPPRALDGGRGQVRSTALLDALEAAKRPEWERLLGVADIDLFVAELNFVFGEGDAKRGVAIFSLARLRPAPDLDQDEAGLTLFRKRAATEAIHELAHSYGLGHCRDPRCVMWFSNTLSESDRKGTTFCEAHRRQLARALRGR